ncbi:hypothetical protein K440DRAFT_633036 [Wilcoxina mikolae CBS 423.85]|nr:hypothetical protein K440DRAFT_633036 [Wilcoxina mikolae CBS 423.85]
MIVYLLFPTDKIQTDTDRECPWVMQSEVWRVLTDLIVFCCVSYNFLLAAFFQDKLY